VSLNYEWSLGKGKILHASGVSLEEGVKRAEVVNEALRLSMPISRVLFKYLGFVARK
jgi:hypothetical protein